jgi:hypothetical protein
MHWRELSSGARVSGFRHSGTGQTRISRIFFNIIESNSTRILLPQSTRRITERKISGSYSVILRALCGMKVEMTVMAMISVGRLIYGHSL